MGGSWFEIDPISVCDYGNRLCKVYQSAVLGGADLSLCQKSYCPIYNKCWCMSVNLKGSGVLLEVMMSRQIMFSKTNPNKIESLSINHWEKGLYIVRVSYDDYSATTVLNTTYVI